MKAADRTVLTVPEAAEYMGVSANSMKRAIARGDIAHIRLGVRVLVPRSELDIYIERSTRGIAPQNRVGGPRL